MKNRVTAPTWAEINLDNINFNLNNIRKLLKEDTKICTVLKANAYGHGSVEIAKFLENKNVDYFAVARLEEAIELRENNIKRLNEKSCSAASSVIFLDLISNLERIGDHANNIGNAGKKHSV